jgi:hypothetical protein
VIEIVMAATGMGVLTDFTRAHPLEISFAFGVDEWMSGVVEWWSLAYIRYSQMTIFVFRFDCPKGRKSVD